jgi:hypothetical protein
MMVVTTVTPTTIFNNLQNFSLGMIEKGRLVSWVITPRLAQIPG